MGLPKRCSGISRDSFRNFLSLCFSPTNRVSRGVSVAPGQMQLTRIPYGAHCSASDLVNAIMPFFEAEYGGRLVEPTSPNSDAVFMIEPLVLFMWGIAYLQLRKTLFKLTSITRFQSSSLIFHSAPPGPSIPALLSSTSSFPKLAMHVLIIAFTSSALETSTFT